MEFSDLQTQIVMYWHWRLGSEEHDRNISGISFIFNGTLTHRASLSFTHSLVHTTKIAWILVQN